MNTVKDLIIELGRFNPNAPLTDESGHREELDLSFRSPATMCGLIYEGKEQLYDKIKTLEGDLTDVEEDYGRMKLCVEEIDELIHSETHNAELCEKIKQLTTKALI